MASRLNVCSLSLTEIKKMQKYAGAVQQYHIYSHASKQKNPVPVLIKLLISTLQTQVFTERVVLLKKATLGVLK